jgi:hypothetical protein
LSVHNKVVLKTFSFPHEAEMAKLHLSANYIESSISDAHTISMQWLYSDAIGGVKLFVAEDDVERAREVLSQDYSSIINEQWKIPKQQCIQCGSHDIKHHTNGKRSAFIVFLLLGFPAFFYKHGFKCQKCDAFWQE